jgi:NAD(P)-dependent dehydrogenase (short-subunit alcohol dehydrogenase family)
MTGRPALVVGGASGIGLACVDALTAAGWNTIVADLKPDPGHEASIALDVRDRAGVHDALHRLHDEHGELGAVVYAAGMARVTPLVDIPEREWDLVIGVNLTGAFNVLQAAAGHMARDSSITIISSIDSMAPVAGLSHYSAAKAGSEAIVRSAAFELGGRGIRCNAVLPGVVRTPLMAAMLERDGVADSFVERTPLGRIADGSDIADVVAFLASPAARWITGVSLPVDGGMSLREHPVLLEEPTSVTHQ